MPLLHFGKRGRLQLVDQVVRLHAKPFAPAHFYIRLFRLLRRKLIPHLRGAPRRQRHNLVGEVNRVLRLFFMSQSSQPFGYHVLQVCLPRINDVVDPGRGLPEVRRLRIALLACRGPDRLPLGSIRPLLVVKVLPQQPEFPELVCNIFSDVRHRPIRTHNDLVLCILAFRPLCVLCALRVLCVNSCFFFRFFLFPRHNPASRHFSARGQMNRAGFLQHLKCRIPEFQVQDFALSRQQVVVDVQPRHRAQVTPYNCVRYGLRHFRIFAPAFFNRFQRRSAQFRCTRLVLTEKARSLRVQVPTVGIELRFCREHLHVDRSALFHVQESDHNVRHLHAGVVDVVLNLHFAARVPQDPHHRVAQHRIPRVSDVRRLIRVDTRVLDDDFLSPAFLSLTRSACFFLCALPKRLPIKVRIQIPAPRHFDFGNPFDLAQAVGNLLCNLPRRPLHPLRQFKTYRRRCLTHLNLRRPFQHNRQLHPILFLYVRCQRLAQSVRQCLVHGSSARENPIKLNHASIGEPTDKGQKNGKSLLPCLVVSPSPYGSELQLRWKGLVFDWALAPKAAQVGFPHRLLRFAFAAQKTLSRRPAPPNNCLFNGFATRTALSFHVELNFSNFSLTATVIIW